MKTGWVEIDFVPPSIHLKRMYVNYSDNMTHKICHILLKYSLLFVTVHTVLYRLEHLNIIPHGSVIWAIFPMVIISMGHVISWKQVIGYHVMIFHQTMQIQQIPVA